VGVDVAAQVAVLAWCLIAWYVIVRFWLDRKSVV